MCGRGGEESVLASAALTCCISGWFKLQTRTERQLGHTTDPTGWDCQEVEDCPPNSVEEEESHSQYANVRGE